MKNNRKFDPYPKTVDEIIEDVNFKKETLELLLTFKKSKPWEGDSTAKFDGLIKDLSKIYKIKPPTVVFLDEFAYGPCFFPVGRLIVMTKEGHGGYSLIALLHEYAHALGMNERGACRWSINLFRTIFPKAFSKLQAHGYLLYKK